MGSSSYGNLAYGIPSTEDFNIRELIEGEDGDGNWETRYYEKKSGTKEPDFDTEREAWHKWGDLKRKAIKDSQIEMMMCGSDYELHYAIVIKSTELSSEWGKVVPIKSLEVKPEWNVAIKDCCDAMGIEYSEPYWFLTSLYL